MNRLLSVLLVVFFTNACVFAENVNDASLPDIDRNKSVGSIPINSDMAPSGAKTYSVPLNVYPGKNGMQPSLAISYNSLQGNSTLGYGWNLSGLSNISRVPKNSYYDTVPCGIQMSKDDAFALDGTRLIKLREEYSYNLYETETGNIKVRGHFSRNTMLYFEAFYPDGTYGIFGWQDNTQDRLNYPQTSASDLFDNTISYNYSFANGHYEISTITYNGFSIIFNYITREDQAKSFVAGQQVTLSRLLRQISCFFAGSEVGKYILSYENENNCSLLTQIDYQVGNSTYNPLRFSYGEGQSLSLQATEIFIPGNSNAHGFNAAHEICMARGRISIDGKSDGMLVYPNKCTYFQGEDCFVNYYHGGEYIYRYMWPENQNTAWEPYDLLTEEGFVDLLCADLTGSQKDEIVKVVNKVTYVGTTPYDKVSFKVYDSSEEHLPQSYERNLFLPVLSCNGNLSIHPKYYYTGDFNGDGKVEVMALSVDKPYNDPSHPSECYIIDLESDQRRFQSHIFDFQVQFLSETNVDASTVANNSDKVFVMDCDGDGKSDIVHINATGLRVYTFDVAYDGQYLWRQVSTYTDLTRATLANRELQIGDVNGDGLCDIMVSPLSTSGSSSIWNVYLSKGNGLFDHIHYSICSRGDDVHSGYVVQDVNNDGRADVIMYTSEGFTVYPASVDGYTEGVFQSFPTRNTILVPFNLNTSGYQTSIISLRGNMITRYEVSDAGKERMLTGMVNSLGVVERNEYTALHKYEGYTVTDIPSEYQNGHAFFILNEPISVISKTKDFVDGVLVDSCCYRYKNAVFNNKGLGFQGFEKIVKSRLASPLGEMAEYDPYRFGVPKRLLTIAKSTTFDYDVVVDANKLAHIQLYSKTEKDLPTDNEVYTQYEYDEYGYPTTEYVFYSDGSQDITENTYHSEPLVARGYNLGYLINSEKTTTYNDDTYTETLSVESYENRKPLLIAKYKNGNRVERKTYQYDNAGNVLEEGESIIASSYLYTRYTYDQYGRVATLTDQLNKTSRYAYDHRGHLSTLTDIRNGVTQYQYDDFGRETGHTNPDGTTYQTLYAWENGEDGILYSVTQSETGTPTSASYYNALGQEVRTSKQLLQNTVQKTDKRYDICGRIRQVSLPYTGDAPQYWNSYTYEDDFPDLYAYDRILSYTEASGKTTNYEYEDNFVTITEDGISRTKEYDSRGNVISVTDQAGTITFNLAADGQPISIISPEGNTTTYTYNSRRYCLRIDDPSAGAIRYTYNGSGLLTIENNGGVTNYTYDTKRRLSTRSADGIVFSYSYNTVGDLIRIAGSNGTSTVFTYDSYGRLTREVENALDGVWLQKDYTYSDGNVSRVIFTSSMGELGSLSYTYDNGCQKETYWRDSVCIKRINLLNAFGIPTNVTTGYLFRLYGYSAYGYPTSRFVFSSQHGMRTHQQLSYQFDPQTGNLLQRRDVKRNISEAFGYDNHNRLVSYGDFQSSYSGEGKLIEKTDVGGFEYNNPNRPYAVTNEQLYNGETPSNVQHMSHNASHRIASLIEDDKQFLFDYNSDADRVKSTVVCDGDTIFKRYYVGKCYEVDVTPEGTKEKLYLGSGDYYDAVAVCVKEHYRLETDSLYYILRDYQGSVTHVVRTDCSVSQELSYDAWGRLRNPDTHQVYRVYEQPIPFLGRGYTGHEHIPYVGLINMNARVYDPVIGSFISPDPYVQDPENSQNYNRYAYCLNNPLKYVDESGEIWWSALIGAAFNGLSYAITTWITHEKWNTGKFFSSMAQGAISGLVSGGVTQLASGLSNVTAGISNNLLRGAATGFLQGTVTGAATGVVDGIFGYANGGSLKSIGNSVWQGAVYGGLNGAVSGMVSAVHNSKHSSLTNDEKLTPHQKGKQGVERSISEFNAQGGSTLGTEITVEVNGTRVRFDYAGYDKSGKLNFVEVKNGKYARRTHNQKIVYGLIEKCKKNGIPLPPIKPIGNNAKNAHLTPGIPITDYIFNEIKY